MASRPPTESDPKGAENADDKASMDRFKGLAKGVFGVSRASYEEEERKFRERERGKGAKA